MEIAWGPTILVNAVVWGGLLALLVYLARRRRR
jgi:MYXO-CTERM domain-containing protein